MDAGTGDRSATELLNPDFVNVPHHCGPLRFARRYFRPDGVGVPASDYEWLCRVLLDPFNHKRAVLSFNIGFQAGLRNPQLAIEATRACNDWNRDHWLGIDDPRLMSVCLVQAHDPAAAAEEIRRVAPHPKIAHVLLHSLGVAKPLGHPAYEPIFRAASEVGKPIAVHVAGEYTGEFARANAGGPPSTAFELESFLQTAQQHHLVSMITGGVFERYPNLKLFLIETGISWIPWFLWSLDANYRRLRRETKWVKRPPSEYFREHVRVSTQPLEIIPGRQLAEWVDEFGLDRILCASSDHPHFDQDDPIYVAKRFSKRARPRIFHGNACEAYGWDEAEVLATDVAPHPLGMPDFPDAPPTFPGSPHDAFREYVTTAL
jgi:hypothetical protein